MCGAVSQGEEDHEGRRLVSWRDSLKTLASIYGASVEGYFELVKLLIYVNLALCVPGMCVCVRNGDCGGLLLCEPCVMCGDRNAPRSTNAQRWRATWSPSATCSRRSTRTSVFSSWGRTRQRLSRRGAPRRGSST
jgi:hypothetical protein